MARRPRRRIRRLLACGLGIALGLSAPGLRAPAPARAAASIPPEEQGTYEVTGLDDYGDDPDQGYVTPDGFSGIESIVDADPPQSHRQGDCARSFYGTGDSHQVDFEIRLVGGTIGMNAPFLGFEGTRPRQVRLLPPPGPKRPVAPGLASARGHTQHRRA